MNLESFSWCCPEFLRAQYCPTKTALSSGLLKCWLSTGVGLDIGIFQLVNAARL